MKLPIYLDYNATTPVDPEVFEAMRPAMLENFGNPSSSTHPHGWYAAELVEIARAQVASLINCQPDEIVFTSGATESNNLAIKGTARVLNSARFCSVLTEHKAVLDPLSSLRKEGFNIELLRPDMTGMLSAKVLEKSISQETKFVSVMFANNEIGTIQPILELTKVCRQNGIIFHSDAAQALARCEIDLQLMNVDLMSLSAHKIYGPKGVGALFIRKKSPASKLQALIDGGSHEFGYRAGTLNVPGIVGFGKACELAKKRFLQDSLQIDQLSKSFLTKLNSECGEIILNGPEERLLGNLNLRITGVDSARLIGKVQTKLAISSSSACQSSLGTPSHVLEAIGLDRQALRECIRIGIGRTTTPEEVDRAVEILTVAIKQIRTANK